LLEALAQKLASSISSAFQQKNLSGHGVSEAASAELSASHAGTGQLASLNHGFRTFHTLSASPSSVQHIHPRSDAWQSQTPSISSEDCGPRQGFIGAYSQAIYARHLNLLS
jgi:hypothetical protein